MGPSASTPTPAPEPVLVGALVPLTPPGWVDAGRHLLAGLELGVDDVNAAGGIGGRPLELVVRDTAADPERAVAVVAELAGLGVAAVVGEYHSVVARAVAEDADARGVPFLCSSAVLDGLTARPTTGTARLAPVQSRGWRTYADFLLATGHRRVAAATQPSAYWAAGTGVLRGRLAAAGGSLVELDADALGPAGLCDALVDHAATALLLLVGHPEPALPITRAARSDPRLADVLLGAPAGQPELPGWTAALGADGAGIPFLRYLPERLGPLGARVEAQLRARLAGAPSFVAFEGWDTVAVLAAAMRSSGTARADVAAAWPHVSVEGTRGRIRFARPSGTDAWQWSSAPVQVVDRDPADPTRVRVLHTAQPSEPAPPVR